MTQGVVEQIRQDLAQTLPVGPEPGRARHPGGQRNLFRRVSFCDSRRCGPDEFGDVDRLGGDGGMGFLRLGQGRDVGRETNQSAGLFTQHPNGFRVQVANPVLHGLDVGLKNRHRRADLVGQIAEQLPSGGFHRLKPRGHLVERRGEVVELAAESRR